MKVGGVAETITVTGETPVVDVQSAQKRNRAQQQHGAAMPATRAAGALLNATPGINVGDTTGAALSPTMTSFNARSSTINATSVGGEGRYAVNGIPADGGAQRRLRVGTCTTRSTPRKSRSASAAASARATSAAR